MRITDSDGRRGWGECTTYWPEASVAAAVIVEPLATTSSARTRCRTDTLMRTLRERTWWYGTGGVGIAGFALSGIDVALWDLKGQVLGTSVLDLLGGPAKETLPAIASSHATGEDIGEMAEEIAGWLATGLTGVKVGLRQAGQRQPRLRPRPRCRVHAAPCARRSARTHDHDRLRRPQPLDGARGRSAACARSRSTASTGSRSRSAPTIRDGYAAAPGRATATQIAYGEREYRGRRRQHPRAPARVDVVGLDPGRVGGITGFAQACDIIASSSAARATPTPGRPPIDTAASLAISWAKPVCKQLEEQPFKGPMQDDLIGGAIVHQNGHMDRPTGPGLGIEVDQAIVDRYLIGR